MNICFLSKSQLKTIGGIETYTDLMSDAFIHLGHNVHIITSGKNINVGLEKKYIKRGINIHKINFEKLNIKGIWRLEKNLPLSLFTYSYLVGRRITELILKNKIDVVESPNRAFEGLACSYKKNIPLIVRLHGGILVDKILNLSQYPFRDRIIQMFEKYLISNANSVTSCSKSISQIVLENYKINIRIQIIPNPIDLKQFYPLPEETNTPMILFVGRFQELKGIFVLAEAIPRVLKEFPKAEFILIGPDSSSKKINGSCRGYLRNKIKDKRVIFYEEMSREELIKFYHKSWICVFPSLYDTFPITALEAIACGKAVIATKVGGLAEIIEDKISGLLIPVANAEALTTAIIELLSNGSYRKQLGENAFKRAREYFDLEKIAHNTLKIYQEAIDKFRYKDG